MIKAPIKHMHIALEADLRARLEAVQARDGLAYTEQIKRALWMWFNAKGIVRKPARRSR
jgi:hypothetical protein